TDALSRMGLRAHATFPLSVGSRVIGAVTFASYERSVIGTADVNILTRIARYTAISLDRVIRERTTVAASHAKDDFLAALSHELRTPLNPILLVASDSATNMAYPLEAREGFQVIEKNAQLEARLIDDLLDMTRIEHGKVSLDMQRLDAHKPLTDALETVGEEIEQRQLRVHVKLEAMRHTVIADSGRLQQVFWNVLKNAVKFTPPGGEVWVTSASNDAATEIAIQIRDTGIGMDENELARVFEAFEQGDHAVSGRSHRFGGLGLGLAISRKLIDLHGGRIAAMSEGKTQGASFTVCLPLAPAPTAIDPAQPAGVPDAAPSAAAALRRAGSRILLVEDHEPTRTTLGHLLKRRGYVVLAVGTSAAALQAAQQQPFDLVLSDIGLPDSDGFTLMRHLREDHGLKGIALTGYGMEEDRLRSTNAGFFAHLTKPINIQQLDRTLENVFADRSS
ncbi:MAG: ATP-binding protein, partial [Opitutaceae bacterium]